MVQKQKITACAFIYKNGKMLGVQRAAHKEFLPNKWELVGGHIEFGEVIENGLKREIKEELNIDVQLEDPFHVFTYLKDKDTHSVEIIFLAKFIENQKIMLDSGALQSYKWLTREEATELYDNKDAEFTAIIKWFDIVKNKNFY